MIDQEPMRAVDELRQAAALAPDVPRIWLRLGVVLYDSGNTSAGVEALETALRLKPDDAETLYYRARVARNMGDNPRAGEVLTTLLETAPRLSPYRILGTYLQAQLCQERKDTDGAATQYEALLALVKEPQGFFQRYHEIYALYNSQLQLRVTLGRLYLAAGKPQKAIAVFKDALADRPDVPELLVLLCQAYTQQKDYAGARDWARKLIDARPDDIAGYQVLAETYRAQGQPNDVIPELEKYRRERPDNRMLAFQLASAYEAADRKNEAAALYRELSLPTDTAQGTSVAAALKLAELAIQSNQPVEAIEALGAALSSGVADSAVLVRGAQFIDGLKDADRAKVYQEAQRLVADDHRNYGPFVLVGMLAESLKRRDEAIALYDKALARQPRAAIAYSRKADLLIDAGRHPDALAVYEAALKAGLDLPAFHRKMGMILEYLGRLDEALAQYRLTRQAAPEDKPTRYLLAGVLTRLGQLEEAEKELQGLVARFPKEVQAHTQLAAIALQRGDLEAAEREVGQAQALEAGAVGPRAVLAEVRFRQKRYPEAEQLARGLLTEQPGAADVRLLLVYILAAQRRFDQAITQVRTLLAADPENLALRYLAAGFCSEMGDTATAEQELQQILQKKPDHPPSNNDLGYLWADRGIHLGQAEQMIRGALKAEPKSPAYLDSLGWVMYKQGRFEEAVRTLQEATQLAPELDAVLWDHLGDAYWRLSRREDAAKAWEAAAKILQAQGAGAKPGVLDRVRQKMQNAGAGQSPDVAPLGAKSDAGPADAKSSAAPQP
jgi:tetratricopeptide (TPR) repeat protein